MLSFIPLHQTEIERPPTLLSWVREWTCETQLEPLTPDEWYKRGHGYRAVQNGKGGSVMLEET